MSEKEKNVMERLVEVLPTLSDFDKGYILGKAEQTAEKRREEKKIISCTIRLNGWLLK